MDELVGSDELQFHMSAITSSSNFNITHTGILRWQEEKESCLKAGDLEGCRECFSTTQRVNGEQTVNKQASKI